MECEQLGGHNLESATALQERPEPETITVDSTAHALPPTRRPARACLLLARNLEKTCFSACYSPVFMLRNIGRVLSATTPARDSAWAEYTTHTVHGPR